MICIEVLSQNVSRVNANQERDMIAITYHLSEDAKISIEVSYDGGKTFEKINNLFLQGDFGKKVKKGDKIVRWYVLAQNSNNDYIHTNVLFRVNAKPLFRPFIYAYGAASLAPQFSGGLMVGQVGIAGWYAKGETSFTALHNTLYTTDNSGNVDGILPFYKGKSSTEFLLVAGGVVKLGCPLYFYTGFGYGKRELYWCTTDSKYIKNTESSSNGYVWDVGLMGNIKHIGISVGASTIASNYWEATLGLGYYF